MTESQDTVQLKIHEIFFSIQGESLLAGKPTVFVRTATCNLRCTWCDTRHSFWKGDLMTVPQIMEQVRRHPTKYVCLTGGEPLGQRGIYPLMDILIAEGKTVSLETSGSFSVADVPAAVIKILDLKCPESGECDANLMSNLQHLTPRDEVKFVIASRQDFEWAKTVCDTNDLTGRCSVLFSPVTGKLSPALLAEWVLEEGVPATMQVQMHKVIWGTDARGV